LEKVDEEWLKGSFGMHEGIFPASFVEILVPLPDDAVAAYPDEGAPPLPESDKSHGAASTPSVSVPYRPGKAMVIHDYHAESEDDLELVAGKTIEIIEAIDGDWLRGRLRNGIEGIFPRSFVEVLEEPMGVAPGSEVHASSSEEVPYATATFDYDAHEAGDLAFKAGEVIILLERLDDQWYRGEVDGRQGIFPSNFVDVIVDC
jgi:hypothetical protein